MMWLILGMFAVTYIPRMVPMVFTKDLTFPGWLEKWLSFVPYAALGALIFPGVLTVNPDEPWIGLIAAIVAFLSAWKWKNIFIPLVTSIFTMYILQMFI